MKLKEKKVSAAIPHKKKLLNEHNTRVWNMHKYKYVIGN